jgi:arylsulfatase A-like enzyme
MAFLLALPACGEPEAQQAPAVEAVAGQLQAPRPDILFISMDTFRLDRLGAASGQTPSPTPNLDALIAEGVLFAPAIAPMPSTLPSHMTMLTGLLPLAHRVLEKKHRLSPEIITLPEALQAAGYRTAAVVTSEWLKPEFGFGRGFDEFTRLPHELTYADRVNAAALQVLDAAIASPPRPEDPPTFVFLHYYDPHSDFEAQGNRLPYYSPPAYRTDLKLDKASFCTDQKRCATSFLASANSDPEIISASTQAAISELYDRGIRYFDDAMGDLLAALRKSGRYDQTLIVITADHGEELGEHGRYMHSQTYDTSLAIPLAIKFPSGRHAGTRVAGPVSLTSLMPTLLDYLEITPPHYLRDGSLLAALEGGKALPQQALSQARKPRQQFTLRTDRYKLFHDAKQDSVALYDLLEDPNEEHDIASEQSATVTQMRNQLAAEVDRNRRLASQFKRASSTAEQTFTSSEEENLRALGYLD